MCDPHCKEPSQPSPSASSASTAPGPKPPPSPFLAPQPNSGICTRTLKQAACGGIIPPPTYRGTRCHLPGVFTLILPRSASGSSTWPLAHRTCSHTSDTCSHTAEPLPQTHCYRACTRSATEPTLSTSPVLLLLLRLLRCFPTIGNATEHVCPLPPPRGSVYRISCARKKNILLRYRI